MGKELQAGSKGQWKLVGGRWWWQAGWGKGKACVQSPGHRQFRLGDTGRYKASVLHSLRHKESSKGNCYNWGTIIKAWHPKVIKGKVGSGSKGKA